MSKIGKFQKPLSYKCKNSSTSKISFLSVSSINKKLGSIRCLWTRSKSQMQFTNFLLTYYVDNKLFLNLHFSF